jgi:hypothetical protein
LKHISTHTYCIFETHFNKKKTLLLQHKDSRLWKVIAFWSVFNVFLTHIKYNWVKIIIFELANGLYFARLLVYYLPGLGKLIDFFNQFKLKLMVYKINLVTLKVTWTKN